jgi:dipeptidyl aminopeptidase/acylaminoacyl peptidase
MRVTTCAVWMVAGLLCAMFAPVLSVAVEPVVAKSVALAVIAQTETDPRRPPAIATEQVPVIPGTVFDRLRKYQSTRAAVFNGWSPDGKGVLIGTRFGDTAQLHRVFTPGGRRQQITFFEEPVDGRFVPRSTDGTVLVTYSAGGNENGQVARLEPETGKIDHLTDPKVRNLLMALRRDGTEAIIGHNGRNGSDTDLFRVSLTKPFAMRPVFETTNESWSATDWSPDGKRLLLLKYVSANDARVALFDLETGKRDELPLPTGTAASFSNPVFSADGKSVYLTCDAWGEFHELAQWNPVTKEYTRLTVDIPWNVESVRVDDTTGRVAFAVNVDGYDKLYVLDGEQRRGVPLPRGLIASLDFSPDGAELGFTLALADAPADVYSVRLADNTLTRHTYSELGGLDPTNFVTAELVRFASFDGREVPAFVFRRKEITTGKKVPVLIDIHGGPEGQYRPFFSGFDQFLVAEGMAVIHPNVRGSDGYGKTYLKLDNAALREDSVKDIGALLDWIARQPGLDPERVAVMGASYGGYMVLASLVHHGERLRAGVDVVGIADFETFLKTTAAYRRDLRRVEYGDERDPAMLEVFAKISPLRHAEKIRSALLVAHGRNDPRVPFTEAEQIAAKVRGAGKPVWTVYADNEGHGFAKKPNRDYLNAVVARFLETHLRGE